jgi:hypothetical protein
LKGGGIVKELNIRQKSFCEFYVASGNATDSAIKAGYSEKYARNRIHELLKSVGICGYIEELREKTKSKRIMNAVERKEWLTNVIKSEKAKMTDKLTAVNILNKMDGEYEYTQKIQLSGKLKTESENKVSLLSTEDLKTLVDGIKDSE